MASSNPFRRKTIAAPFAGDRFPPLDAIDTVGTPPPPTSFRTPEQPPETSAGDKKAKPVKKVRVLSPPPLSPDSPAWPFHPPVMSAVEGHAAADSDPFDGASTDDSDREGSGAPLPTPNAGRAPGNPFSRTLRDLEDAKKDQELERERKEEGAALKAANSGKGTLDVDSFKRLLMAGIDADSLPHDGSPDISGLGHGRYDGNADNNKGTSYDDNTAAQASRGKKPPPPPSSRHGKSIKSGPKSEDIPDAGKNRNSTDLSRLALQTSLRRSFEEDTESLFDRESRGKILEPDLPTSAKKPIPAPPPRRGHARAQSRTDASGALGSGQNAQKPYDHDPPSRSSMDSMHSRTNSIRSGNNIPAPPPPRRPQAAASKQSSNAISPTTASFATPLNQPTMPSLESERSSGPTRPAAAFDPSAIREPQSGSVKPSGPPPPPARNVSVRRPASIQSVESISRRVSGESKNHNGVAPPPPPRRQRGNSRGSVDGPSQRTSFDSVGKFSPTHPGAGFRASMNGTTSPGAVAAQFTPDAGHGANILADLEALQREVDALRGVTR